jgi:mRNA interferase RelE/StbE
VTRAAPWQLELDSSALRTLRQIPERYAAAIVEHVTGPLLEAPRRLGGRLDRELGGYLCSRVGPYRIVYRVLDDERTVRVARIEHRADVYRLR